MFGIKMSKTCHICKEEIKYGAKKCIHCGSYQDWRQHLSVSHTTLALVIALISVVSVSFPIIQKIFTPNSEKVVLGLLERRHKSYHLKVYAYNTGTKEGILQPSGYFILTNSKGIQFRELALIRTGGDGNNMKSYFIRPNDIEVFFVNSYPSKTDPLKIHKDLKRCEFEYEVKSPPSMSRKGAIEFPCY